MNFSTFGKQAWKEIPRKVNLIGFNNKLATKERSSTIGIKAKAHVALDEVMERNRKSFEQSRQMSDIPSPTTPDEAR